MLDVPLLLETGGDRRVDAVAVVWASPMLQAQRALRRPGMTAAKLASIRAEQLPDWLKKKRADYVIPSGFDGGVLAGHVAAVIADLRPPPAPGLATPPPVMSVQGARVGHLGQAELAVALPVEGEPARAGAGARQAGGTQAGGAEAVGDLEDRPRPACR